MRLKALQDFPMGTQMARPFESDDGVRRVVVGQVWDFQVPYGRVWCPDGDWEELCCREMTSGVWKCESTQDKEAETLRRQRAQCSKARQLGGRKTRLLPGTPALSRRQPAPGWGGDDVITSLTNITCFIQEELGMCQLLLKYSYT